MSQPTVNQLPRKDQPPGVRSDHQLTSNGKPAPHAACEDQGCIFIEGEKKKATSGRGSEKEEQGQALAALPTSISPQGRQAAGRKVPGEGQGDPPHAVVCTSAFYSS